MTLRARKLSVPVALAALLLSVAGVVAPAQATGTASISGNVQGDAIGANPLNGATVSLYLNNTFVESVSTDAAGDYSATALDPGTYQLRFAPPFHTNYQVQWWDHVATAALSTSFAVAAGEQVTGKNALLLIGGQIEGTVTGEGSPNAPLQNATVVAFDATGQPSATTSTASRTPSRRC